jgi:hypothetical protein
MFRVRSAAALFSIVGVTMVWAPAAVATHTASRQVAGVILWNRLDDAHAVRHSVVGPNGTLLGGSFVPGRFGRAYQAKHDQDYLARFPSWSVNRLHGTVEFWGRIVGFSQHIDGDGGNQPGFFTIIDDRGKGFGQVFLTGNDGAGGGGVTGFAGHNETAAGPFGSWDYSQVLGPHIYRWHHYALVWDANGIHGVDNGKRRVAVFVDGVLASHFWDTVYAGPFPAYTPTTMLRLGTIDRIEQGAVQVDNLITWNCAVTDFHGRDIQKPIGRFCS